MNDLPLIRLKDVLAALTARTAPVILLNEGKLLPPKEFARSDVQSELVFRLLLTEIDVELLEAATLCEHHQLLEAGRVLREFHDYLGRVPVFPPTDDWDDTYDVAFSTLCCAGNYCRSLLRTINGTEQLGEVKAKLLQPLGDESWVSPRDISDRVTQLSYAAIQKRLQRWREDNKGHSGHKEVVARKSRDPMFLYKWGCVKQLFQSA